MQQLVHVLIMMVTLRQCDVVDADDDNDNVHDADDDSDDNNNECMFGS